MGKKIDLTGQKYNKLTVIKETEKRDSSGCVIWQCQCDCGNVTYASSNALRSGHKQSCGCSNKEQITAIGEKNVIDITGQRFGKLIVLEKTNIRKDRKVCWKCQCDCGNIYIATGVALRKGNVQSCGCLKSIGEEKIAKILSENNIIFEREKIFADFNPRYRYDFYVNNEYIIEYDGKQHFQDYSWGNKQHSLEESRQRDEIKNQYCFKKDIPIIRIPYTYLEKITIKDLQIETSNFIVQKEKKYND